MQSSSTPGPKALRSPLPPVLTMLTIEILTGFYMYVIALSKPATWLVLLHSAMGIAIVVQVARRYLATRVQASGVVILVSALGVLISGVGLTYQATFTDGTGFGWDMVHFISVALLVGTTLPKLFAVARKLRQAAPAVQKRVPAEAELAEVA